jgi:hypothetical protein
MEAVRLGFRRSAAARANRGGALARRWSPSHPHWPLPLEQIGNAPSMKAGGHPRSDASDEQSRVTFFSVSAVDEDRRPPPSEFSTTFLFCADLCFWYILPTACLHYHSFDWELESFKMLMYCRIMLQVSAFLLPTVMNNVCSKSSTMLPTCTSNLISVLQQHSRFNATSP